jgi:hypothetical protein
LHQYSAPHTDAERQPRNDTLTEPMGRVFCV